MIKNFSQFNESRKDPVLFDDTNYTELHHKDVPIDLVERMYELIKRTNPKLTRQGIVQKLGVEFDTENPTRPSLNLFSPEISRGNVKLGDIVYSYYIDHDGSWIGSKHEDIIDDQNVYPEISVGMMSPYEFLQALEFEKIFSKDIEKRISEILRDEFPISHKSWKFGL